LYLMAEIPSNILMAEEFAVYWWFFYWK
jgi:hypothetical protein